MHILAAFGIWLGVIILGLIVVMLIISGLHSTGVGGDALTVISFILGFPIGIVAALSALAVYDRLD